MNADDPAHDRLWDRGRWRDEEWPLFDAGPLRVHQGREGGALGKRPEEGVVLGIFVGGLGAGRLFALCGARRCNMHMFRRWAGHRRDGSRGTGEEQAADGKQSAPQTRRSAKRETARSSRQTHRVTVPRGGAPKFPNCPATTVAFSLARRAMDRRSAFVPVVAALALACGRIEPVEDVKIPSDASVLPEVLPDAGPDVDAGLPDVAAGCPDAGYTATVSWNGTPIYVTPQAELRRSKVGSYTYVWGAVFDPEFRVDEGILAFDLPLSLAPGRYSCVLPEDFSPSGTSAVVYFSEHRGFDFVADPTECAVEILASCDDGRPHFRMSASYDSTFYGRVRLEATVE